MDDMPTAEMPRYRSHKVVHALKLDFVAPVEGQTKVLFSPSDKTYAPITHEATDEVVKRCRAQQMADPGYYVVYPDGFISWSPTQAFEEGYALLEVEGE